MSEAYEEKQWDVFCENNDLRLENDQLKAENAKLRELVKGMYYDLTHVTLFPRRWLIGYEAIMRELGMEVDE